MSKKTPKNGGIVTPVIPTALQDDDTFIDDGQSVRTEEEVEKMRENDQLPEEPFNSDSEDDDQRSTRDPFSTATQLSDAGGLKTEAAESSERGFLSSQINDANSTTSSKNQSGRERRKMNELNDLDKRDFICGCGKGYLSYAALFTHSKIKHDSKFYAGTIFFRKNRYFLANEGNSTSMPSKGDFSEVTPEILMNLEFLNPDTKMKILNKNNEAGEYRPTRSHQMTKVVRISAEQMLQKVQTSSKQKLEILGNESFHTSLSNFELFLASLNCRKDMEVSTADAEFVREEAHMFVVTQQDLQRLSFLPKSANGMGDAQELIDLFPMHWFSDPRIASPIYKAMVGLVKAMQDDFKEVFELDIDLINTEYELNGTKALALFLIFMFRQVSTQFYQELCVLICFLRYTSNLILSKEARMETPANPDTESFCEVKDGSFIPQVLQDFLTKHYYSAMVNNRQMLKSAGLLQILKPMHLNRCIKVCKLLADWFFHFSLSDWLMGLAQVEFPIVAQHHTMQMMVTHMHSNAPTAGSSSSRPPQFQRQQVSVPTKPQVPGTPSSSSQRPQPMLPPRPMITTGASRPGTNSQMVHLA